MTEKLKRAEGGIPFHLSENERRLLIRALEDLQGENFRNYAASREPSERSNLKNYGNELETLLKRLKEAK